MVNEFLLGLLLETKVFLNLDPPITDSPPIAIYTNTPSPTPSEAPSSDVPIPSPSPSKAPSVKKPKSSPQVRAVQISLLTKESVLAALNEYRSKNGVGALQIDDKLQSYAQTRADYLKSLGRLDKHAGHNEFMKNGGFQKLGFNSIAENQSWNYKGDATSLIENLYGKSSGHNKNQLNGEYTHIGIGINGSFTDLVFGGRKK